jgi:glycosyltransferase involved in cell wall biosynthesis
MTPSGVELSVVIPVFGCAPCLVPLYDRLTATLSDAAIDYEIVFVDDASRDGAGAVLRNLVAEDARIKVVSLTENRGQPAAIAEGLTRAAGRWCAVMDCDLEDPPELLPRMLKRVAAGFEIIVGRRERYERVGWRRVVTRVFAVLARYRHGTEMLGRYSTFSVLSRRAVEADLGRAERTAMYLPIL